MVMSEKKRLFIAALLIIACIFANLSVNQKNVQTDTRSLDMDGAATVQVMEEMEMEAFI